MVWRSVLGVTVLMGLAACGGGNSATADDDAFSTSAAAPVAVAVAPGMRDIALVHHALIFDPSRRAYYASVPGSMVGLGNTIARIDASTGTVTASRTIGSEPGPLALARDGSALYVGLNGSGEVVKLALPSLEEQWRVRLPAPQFDGQLTAQALSASPDNPDVLAVSMRKASTSPAHAGVVLIKGGVLQPRQTQAHTGSNLITFGTDGAFVYGLNNETSEFGLRRIAVVADGLVEEAVVNNSIDNYFARTLDRMGSSVIVDGKVYALPSMALMGAASAAGGCRPAVQGERLLCFGTSLPFGEGTIVVVDARTFATVGTQSFLSAPQAAETSFSELVPGISGQVAMRYYDFLYDVRANRVRLFSNAAFP